MGLRRGSGRRGKGSSSVQPCQSRKPCGLNKLLRLSPTILVQLIEWADGQLAELFAGLDPYGPAIFPVAWAGESESQNWFDVGRD